MDMQEIADALKASRPNPKTEPVNRYTQGYDIGSNAAWGHTVETIADYLKNKYSGFSKTAWTDYVYGNDVTT